MKVLLLAALAGCALAQSPTVEEIMSRVGRNQAKALDARQQFVYQQKTWVRLMRTNGKLAREERREYRVIPEPRQVKREMIAFDGRYVDNGQSIAYSKPGYERKSVDIDAALLDEFLDELIGDAHSRDGIANDLFPLTYHQQLKYKFHLVGREEYHGRPVYRVSFEPKEKTIWKGEALIDAEEYQPIFVNTRMAHGVPLMVQTLLGTNLRGLGFSVSYQRFDDRIWFPMSYGGEFELRAVFFYKRNISISMTNSDFRRTSVASNVSYPDLQP